MSVPEPGGSAASTGTFWDLVSLDAGSMPESLFEGASARSPIARPTVEPRSATSRPHTASALKRAPRTVRSGGLAPVPESGSRSPLSKRWPSTSSGGDETRLPGRDRGIPMPQLLANYRAAKELPSEAAVIALAQVRDRAAGRTVHRPPQSTKEYVRKNYARYRNILRSHLLGPVSSGSPKGVDPDPRGPYTPLHKEVRAIPSEAEDAVLAHMLPLSLLFRTYSHVFVKRLDLAGWGPRMTETAFLSLPPVLANLSHLSLSGCHLIPPFAWKLPMSYATNLVHLDLSDNPSLGDDAVEMLAMKCSTLTHINISDTRLGSHAVGTLVASSASSLKHLLCNNCPRLTALQWLLLANGLHTLHARGCSRLDLTTARGLLASLTLLSDLDLSSSSLDDKDALCITHGLGTWPVASRSSLAAPPPPSSINPLTPLRKLSIASCPGLTVDGVLHLLSCCGPSLQNVDVSGVCARLVYEDVEALVARSRGITALALAASGLEDDHVTALNGLSKLRSLVLAGNARVTDSAFASWQGTSLTKLDAGGCGALGDAFLTGLLSSWRVSGVNVCIHRGATASQSSTGHGRVPKLALQVPSDTQVGGRSVTTPERCPWWEVDFGRAVTLDHVVIHHDMAGSLSTPLIKLTVLLSAHTIHGTSLAHAVKSVSSVGGMVFPDISVNASPIHLFLPNLQPCRYVRIQAGKRYTVKLLQNLAGSVKAMSRCRLALHSVTCLQHGITDLNLSHSAVTDIGLHTIAGKLPRLRKLNLAACGVSDMGVSKLVLRCSTLQSLDLSGTPAVTPRAMHAIAASCSHLLQLYLRPWATIADRDGNKAPDVVEVDMDVSAPGVERAWGITDKCLHKLAVGCPLLKWMDVSGLVKITNSGVLLLHGLTSLQHLDCTGCPRVTHAGLADLCQSLQDCEAFVPKLVGTPKGVGLVPLTPPLYPMHWKGVRHSLKRASDRRAALCVRQEKLEHIAAEIIQFCWRQLRTQRAAKAQLGLSGHYNLTRGLMSVHGPEAVGMATPLTGFFVKLSQAATMLVRWWRRTRRAIWVRAAKKIQNSWRWMLRRIAQRRHVAAVLIQKVFRGHVGRKRMQHRRSCSFTLIRLGKLLILKQNMRRWGRVRLLHLRVAPRPFQREYRRHRARLALAAQVTKGLRLMNLALLFWVINVNLKYLWGRTMIEKNRMIVRRQRAARLIQRRWIEHITHSTVSSGWNYAKIRALVIHTKLSNNAQKVQRFVRKTFLRRKMVLYAQKLQAAGPPPPPPRGLPPPPKHGGRHGSKPRHGKRKGSRRRRHKPVKPVVPKALDPVYLQRIQVWARACYSRSWFFVQKALARWLVRARYSLKSHQVTPLQVWWRTIRTRRRTSANNRILLVYRYARQYEAWLVSHAAQVEAARQEEADLPLGVGDMVRARYHGGVFDYMARVIGTHWGINPNQPRPISYSVRYLKDGVVEHDVPRTCLAITQKSLTRALLDTRISNRVLLKDLPKLNHRQPQRLTDFERRLVLLAGKEASIDYVARGQVPKPVGLVDVRIVVGEGEDKRMFAAQVPGSGDRFEKLPVDLRHRKRQYHDSNVAHLWTKTSDEGPFITQLAVLGTQDLLSRAPFLIPRLKALLKHGYTELVWPNRSDKYAISDFLPDKGTEALVYPPEPKYGITFALAVKYGMGAADALAPIGDVAVSTSRALSLMTKSEGVKTEGMLFAARFTPLPENLGVYGADDACRIWVRWGLSPSRPMHSRMMDVPEALPRVERRGNYLTRYEAAKRAELEASFAEVMGMAPREGPVVTHPAAATAKTAKQRVEAVKTRALAVAAMMKAKAAKTQLAAKVQTVRAALHDDVIESEDETDDESLRGPPVSEEAASRARSDSGSEGSEGEETSESDSDSSVTSLGSKSTYRGSDDSAD